MAVINLILGSLLIGTVLADCPPPPLPKNTEIIHPMGSYQPGARVQYGCKLAYRFRSSASSAQHELVCNGTKTWEHVGILGGELGCEPINTTCLYNGREFSLGQYVEGVKCVNESGLVQTLYCSPYNDTSGAMLANGRRSVCYPPSYACSFPNELRCHPAARCIVTEVGPFYFRCQCGIGKTGDGYDDGTGCTGNTCTVPTIPAHATLFAPGNATTLFYYYSEISYQCNPGYRFVAAFPPPQRNRTIRCSPEGNWASPYDKNGMLPCEPIPTRCHHYGQMLPLGARVEGEECPGMPGYAYYSVCSVYNDTVGIMRANTSLPCEDIDECSSNSHNCHANSNCSNTAGSFTCPCISGFTGNGTFCLGCPATWNAVYSSGTGTVHCVKFSGATTMNYSAAEKHCNQDMRAHLVRIYDSQFNKDVHRLAGNVHSWIGLDDRVTETKFQWIDNKQVILPSLSSASFSRSNPDNSDEAEHCVHQRAGDGKWNDISCSKEFAFTCEITNHCPPSWNAVYSTGTGSVQCVKFSGATTMSYSAAEKHCNQDMGAHLVHIYDSQFNRDVHQLAGNVHSWIGLDDRAREGEFRWRDNHVLSPSLFTALFRRPNPDNWRGREDCVHQHAADGKWNDNLCSINYPFTCGITSQSWRAYLSECKLTGTMQAANFTEAQRICNEDFNARLPNGDERHCLHSWLVDKNLGAAWINTLYTPGIHYVSTNDLEHPLSTRHDDNVIDVVCAAACLPTWNAVYSTGTGTVQCLKFSGATTMKYSAAEKHCNQDMGSHLVHISDSQFNRDVHRLTGNVNSWIGLDDRVTEGVFRWIDNKQELLRSLSSALFSPPNPDNSGGNEHCVQQQAGDGKWNDIRCSVKFPFTCEINNCPPSWNAVYSTVTETLQCVKFSGATAMNYSAAEKHCNQDMGAHLVHIYDPQFNRDVHRLAGHVHSWIGLDDRVTDGEFRWLDNNQVVLRSLSSALFRPSNPDNFKNAEHCVHQHAGEGKWNDIPCSVEFAFTCEITSRAA